MSIEPTSHNKHMPAAMPHNSHVEDHGEGNWLVSYADMMTLLVGFFVILLSFSTVDQEKFEEAKKEITKEFGGVYQAPFEETAERIRQALSKAGLGDQLVIKQTESGVEIAFHGAVFFETGSADLKSDARQVLSRLIGVIKEDKTKFKVLVEGHTDDVPLSSGSLTYRDNWELSSIRACRVLDSFVDAGFDIKQLTAVGYADSRPILPNRDAQGNAIPANQSQNRRVVIKLTKPDTSAIGTPSGPPETDATKKAQ